MEVYSRQQPLKLLSLLSWKEAVLTALALAKTPRDPEQAQEWREVVQGWTPPVTGHTSFLDGLPKARLREDQMIIQDYANVPGFELLDTTPYSAATFASDTVRLTVILTNKLPLEEQLGTDLIYYNETFQCFVMVQYKAMEGDNDGEVFRLPDEQLDKEIARMDSALVALRACTVRKSCDGFRLNQNPFYLKLCRRIVFNPDDVSQVDGMYEVPPVFRLPSGSPYAACSARS